MNRVHNRQIGIVFPKPRNSLYAKPYETCRFADVQSRPPSGMSKLVRTSTGRRRFPGLASKTLLLKNRKAPHLYCTVIFGSCTAFIGSCNPNEKIAVEEAIATNCFPFTE